MAGAFVALQFGCGRPNAVEGVARTSKFAPNFYDATNSEDTDGDNGNGRVGSPFVFLHSDCYAVFRLSVAEIIQRPEFADVGWNDLQVELANWVGLKNSKLENLKWAWVLLDRETVSPINTVENGELPFTLVLEYAEPINAQVTKSSALASMVAPTSSINENGS